MSARETDVLSGDVLYETITALQRRALLEGVFLGALVGFTVGFVAALLVAVSA